MSKKIGMALPFASLLSRAKSKRAEDTPPEGDDRDQRDDESDEDYAKRMEDLDEKEKAEDEEREKEKARKAEDEEKDKKAKRAKADDDGGDDDDDDDDGDDEDDPSAKAARRAERARCAKIIAHGITVGAVRQAGVFAFDTKMSSKAAIAALDAVQADSATTTKRGGLAERMAGTQVPNPGAGDAGGKMTLAQQIVHAAKKRRGEI